jgi:hypothetical protein
MAITHFERLEKRLSEMAKQSEPRGARPRARVPLNAPLPS